jgi:hypothetical protein
MAPSKNAVAPYAKDEKVLCFHHEMLYEAKILEVRPTKDNQTWEYRIHYKGWKNTYVYAESTPASFSLSLLPSEFSMSLTS